MAVRISLLLQPGGRGPGGGQVLEAQPVLTVHIGNMWGDAADAEVDGA